MKRNKQRAPLKVLRLLGGLMLLLLGGVAALMIGVGLWLHQPMGLSKTPVELDIEVGQSPHDIARAWVDAGVQVSPWLLYQWFRWSGESRKIRAGSYELSEPLTPKQLLSRLVAGEQSFERVRLIEGWTFKQMRAALAQAPGLRQDSAALSPEALMVAMGASGVPPEGRFFPDTYAYAKGSSDLKVYDRAYRAMNRQLARAWTQRTDQTSALLVHPDDVLKLASIVEKETGRAEDRPMIAGVFINRLRRGMPLQTDPTVIYGLGESFDGNLRRGDLKRDGPFNTYTRTGLPPTPIALPSRGSLQAAVQPAVTEALYFVARGDGSSQFSETLDEHNRAVNRFQRNRSSGP
ncbi:MAG: endolytic transglycosylase MltG [Leptothrix ochracea]|uniref:endolytic transglycosylase MltG n=1 Tax=Leptothrix ochracea TaxID=735331 RepID=UPI0034E1B263